MYEAYQLEPTIEPLQKVLGHLADMIRLDQQTGEHRQADGGLQFVLHQHELDDLPGITHDAIDEDGPVWLAVERPSDIAPPPPEYDLESWIEVSADPEQQPLVRDSVVITVGDIEKDLMVAAEDVRAEDCAPAIAPEAASAMWNVRLRLDRRPDLAARISAYVTGPWTAWAESARRRHRATPIYRRLHEMAELADLDGADRTWELVFGIGVSRWQHRGGSVEVPLLERLVEIEVAAGPAAEIRIRPRMVGAIVNLGVFEALSPDAARLARHGAGRILEAIERGGEVSPFVRESFEPILRAISSELDPQGIYRPDPGPPHSASSSPDAGEQLVVSDRWVIFARPRGNGFVRRDIDRLKLAIEQSPNRECCLSAGSGVLPSDAGGGGIAVVPQALSGVPGEPIDIASAARADGADNGGDVFYPLPASPDQIDIVRQLARSDGVVVEGARGAERTDAIVNVVCHYLALGRRVLVVSRKVARLALVRERLPRAIRDLTVSLTATDKEGLRQAEGVVARLQSIVETLNLRDQGTRINRLQHHILRTRREISGIDEEVANIADSSLQRLSGIADQQFDPVKTLLEDRNAHSWLDDRPRRLLSATDPLVAAMTLAREARARVAEELIHIDDELPQITELPDPEALVRLHEELRRIRIVAVSPADSSEGVRARARRAVTMLREEESGQLAVDLDTLAAAHRVIAAEPWLGPLSPIDPRASDASAEVELLLGFARDAAFQLSMRAGFVTRPVETPADMFADKELIAILDRLAAGEKVFTPFAWRNRRLKQVIDSVLVAGFAPSGRGDWAWVRGYLAWRLDMHVLNARWRSLARDIGAPALDMEGPHAFHGLERIVKCVDAAIVSAGEAKHNVIRIAVEDLAVAEGEIEAMVSDARRLEAFRAAVKDEASRLAALRAELARLEQLFSGSGAVAAFVRRDVLSRIGHDDVEPRQMEANWISVRAVAQSTHDHREDFELIDDVSRMVADAGAPALARRMRAEAANRETGDRVLVADWAEAWNWAALMREVEDLGLDQRLRHLSDRRNRLESALPELLADVVAARVHLGLAHNMSGAVRRALTVFMIFMITLRKMAGTCSGPTVGRLRRLASDALESCHDGIPCWIMPTWRVAEQAPARLGTFDLVIIDEGTQSDLRDLTTMVRGRKILVVDEDGCTGPDIVSANVEVEHDLLDGVPQPIREFLRPGHSLRDLVSVMFPDRLIRLRERARGDRSTERVTASEPSLRVDPRAPVAADSPDPAAPETGRTAPPMDRAAETHVIEDEIARFADELALARTVRSASSPGSRPIIHIDRPAPFAWAEIGELPTSQRTASRRLGAAGAGWPTEDRAAAAAALFNSPATAPSVVASKRRPEINSAVARTRGGDGFSGAPEDRGEAGNSSPRAAHASAADRRVLISREPAPPPALASAPPRRSGGRRVVEAAMVLAIVVLAAAMSGQLARGRISKPSWTPGPATALSGAAASAKALSD